MKDGSKTTTDGEDAEEDGTKTTATEDNDDAAVDQSYASKEEEEEGAEDTDTNGMSSSSFSSSSSSSSSSSPPPPAPVLVRGLTGCPVYDLDANAWLASMALDKKKKDLSGWDAAVAYARNRSETNICDVSGNGGARTYKVEWFGDDDGTDGGRIVALHRTPKSLLDNPKVQRMEAAAWRTHMHYAHIQAQWRSSVDAADHSESYRIARAAAVRSVSSRQQPPI